MAFVGKEPVRTKSNNYSTDEALQLSGELYRPWHADAKLNNF